MLALTSLVLQAPSAVEGMTTAAWVFMLAAWILVIWLNWFTFSRIFGTEEHFDPDGLGPEHSPVPPTHEEE